MNIGILTICTGDYFDFLQQFKKSIFEKFLKNHSKKIYVFTDKDFEEDENTIRIHQESLGWPYNTMMRFHMFNRIHNELSKFDYLFFFNINMFINEEINEEVLPLENDADLIGVIHPGFFNKEKHSFTYERNSNSNFFIDYDKGEKYYQGCFNGGKAKSFLKMSKILSEKIDDDLSKDIIPIWHDESALNWYFSKEKIFSLSPAYAYPEKWDIPFDRKIIQLDKSNFNGKNYYKSR